MLKKSCLVAIKALTPWLIPTLLFGHAGSLDINGGSGSPSRRPQELVPVSLQEADLRG